MDSVLIDTLQSVGKTVETCDSPDGTQVLVLPYGGRVLGLFAPDSDENFYWTNDALKSPESARRFYAGDEWHNSGGDRTWLAPEVDLFMPNFPILDGYFQQRSLDPGHYEVVRDESGFRLVNRLTVHLSRFDREVDMQITKSVGPALNPLRYERGIDLGTHEYAGYSLFTSLELLSGDVESGIRVGLWNLVQMPHGGDLLVPTYFKSEPRIFFGDVPPNDLIVEDHLVRYKMRQECAHKIAIRATATAGRVGYVYQSGDRWSLVVRNFSVNPSGEYVDVPWDEPDYLGYPTQACNVNDSQWQFSELRIPHSCNRF